MVIDHYRMVIDHYRMVIDHYRMLSMILIPIHLLLIWLSTLSRFLVLPRLNHDVISSCSGDSCPESKLSASDFLDNAFHWFVSSGYSTRRRPFVVIFASPWTASSDSASQRTHAIHFPPRQSHCGWFERACHFLVFEGSAQCGGSFTQSGRKLRKYEWRWNLHANDPCRQLLGQGMCHWCSPPYHWHMLILLSQRTSFGQSRLLAWMMSSPCRQWLRWLSILHHKLLVFILKYPSKELMRIF